MNSPLNRDNPMEASRRIGVSVVIPARNEARVIGQCLDALTKVDFPAGAWEVIVVDNGSTDETIAIAQSYAGRLNLRIARREGYISAVRNHGAAMAGGDLLAFLDADCAPAPDWLKLASELSGPQRVVGAYYRIPLGSSWVARAWYGYECEEKDGLVQFVPSGDLFVHKDAFAHIGGFDETIETNEDYDFCQRASAAGFEVLAVPSLAVTHFGTPQSLAGFYRKQQWHGKHVLAVTLRDLSAFRNARAVSFAAYTLVAVTGVVIGLCAGLLGKGYGILALAAAALVLAPALLAARLSLHRKRTGDWFPLAALFLTYGLARARCLLDVGAVLRRSRPRLLLKPGSDSA